MCCVGFVRSGVGGRVVASANDKRVSCEHDRQIVVSYIPRYVSRTRKSTKDIVLVTLTKKCNDVSLIPPGPQNTYVFSIKNRRRRSNGSILSSSSSPHYLSNRTIIKQFQYSITMYKTILFTLFAGAAAFAPSPAFAPRPSTKLFSELEGKVKDIIVEQLGVEADKVVPGASFIDDLGADSLDTVELIMAIEEEFDTEIPEEEAASIATVQDAIDFVSKL